MDIVLLRLVFVVNTGKETLTFVFCQLLEHLADDLANALQSLQIILTFLELLVQLFDLLAVCGGRMREDD